MHICRSSRSCFPWNVLQNSTKRFLWRIHPWIWYSRNAGQCTIDTWAGDIICILQSTIITCRHSSVSTSLRRLSGCSPFTHSMNNAFCVCKRNTTCSHSNETTSAVLYKLERLKKLSWVWRFKLNIFPSTLFFNFFQREIFYYIEILTHSLLEILPKNAFWS